MSTSITLAKNALRSELKKRLASLSLEERARQSKIISDKVLQSTTYKASKRICLYLSMAEEVSTIEILEDVLNSGCACFIPRYSKDDMQMLRLHSMDDYANLPLTKWNIRQPSGNDERENALETGGLDLILVPGLAFTKHGDRLGRGKGYYDKYLSKVLASQSRKPTSMGLAFKEQIVERIPVSEQDIRIHEVIYPVE